MAVNVDRTLAAPAADPERPSDLAHLHGLLMLYGDLHRFIPALALREGYRVDEVAVPQHPNDARTRIYGPGVYLRRLLDVAAFFFLAKFTEKPLRFFGLVGTVFFGLGAVIGLVLLVERLAGQGIANRPLLRPAWKKSRRMIYWGTGMIFMAGWAINLIRIMHG